jgi:hypothetical protein
METADSRSRNGVQNLPAVIEGGSRGLNVMASMETAWRFATAVVKARMAPKSLDSAEKVLIALQMGAEVGLSPMQSLSNIAVVNGRPVMWGDALVALVRRSPQCEWISESWEGEGESRVAVCCAKRRGQPEECRRFGYADAKRAGLLSRDTYRAYPDRMFQCRARAWAVRDVFPDLLMGLGVAEEVQDQVYIETAQPELESGDDAPLNSLDDAAALLDVDESRPSAPTPEELREQEQERRGDKLFETADEFDRIPF